jgi:hypothetical protein
LQVHDGAGPGSRAYRADTQGLAGGNCPSRDERCGNVPISVMTDIRSATRLEIVAPRA